MRAFRLDAGSNIPLFRRRYHIYVVGGAVGGSQSSDG
jgi:hypothetical protein